MPGGVQRLSPYQVGTPDDLASELLARGEDCLLVGDGAVALPGDRSSEVARARRRDIVNAYPSAAALVELAHPRALREEFVPRWELEPLYLRKTDAEINWDRRRTGPGSVAWSRPDDAGRATPAEPAELVVHMVPMRRRHLRSVLRIEAQVYPRPWSLGLFMSELALRNSRAYYVARVDGVVVGYGGLMVSADDGHITTLAVDPAWHRRKIGTRLLLALAREAIRRGRPASPSRCGWATRGPGAVPALRLPPRRRPQELLRRDQRGRPGHVGRRRRQRRVRAGACDRDRGGHPGRRPSIDDARAGPSTTHESTT